MSPTTIASWTFPEYTKPNRDFVWYLIVLIVVAGLLAYSVFSLNYLFTVFIILAGVVLILRHKNKPLRIKCQIKPAGISLGKKFYAYSDLDSFWLIYQPPAVKSLYFSFKSKVKMRLSVPLGSQNPIKIREILLKFLPEDLTKEEEPISETLARAAKL
ncbi:MAG: hypothetical protein AAB740_01285 [Patescibacteria group bacterium]